MLPFSGKALHHTMRNCSAFPGSRSNRQSRYILSGDVKCRRPQEAKRFEQMALCEYSHWHVVDSETS